MSKVMVYSTTFSTELSGTENRCRRTASTFTTHHAVTFLVRKCNQWIILHSCNILFVLKEMCRVLSWRKLPCLIVNHASGQAMAPTKIPSLFFAPLLVANNKLDSIRVPCSLWFLGHSIFVKSRAYWRATSAIVASSVTPSLVFIYIFMTIYFS